MITTRLKTYLLNISIYGEYIMPDETILKAVYDFLREQDLITQEEYAIAIARL